LTIGHRAIIISFFLAFCKKKKRLYKCTDVRVWCEKWGRFLRPGWRKSMPGMEIKFFYFFGILALGMAAFGRAFLPILTRQAGVKADCKIRNPKLENRNKFELPKVRNHQTKTWKMPHF